MNDLHIRRVSSVYHLPETEPDLRRDIDEVLDRALNEFLEPCLSRLGLSSDGELYLRKVFVPIRFKRSASSIDLASTWAMSIALAAQRARHEARESDVVWFPSRAEATAEWAVATLRGDARRNWVWQRIGFIPDGDAYQNAHESSASFRRLHQVLSNEVALFDFILQRIFDAGLLPRLLLAFDSWQWLSLARIRAALIAGPANTVSQDYASAIETSWRAPLPTSTRASLDRQPLFRVRRHWPASIETRWALNALTLAGVEPGLLLSRQATAYLCSLFDLSTAATLADAVLPDSADAHSSHDSHTHASAVSNAESSSTSTLASIAPDQDGQPVIGSTARDSATSVESRRARYGASATEPVAAHLTALGSDSEMEALNNESMTRHANARPLPGWSTEPTAATAQLETAEQHEPPRIARQRSASSSWGGLLYLLNVLRNIQLPERAIDEGLEGRPLRWYLHQLAIALCGAQPDDPAVLAFAGLCPDAVPPSVDETGATTEELARVSLWRKEIVACVHRRLSTDEPLTSGRTPEHTVERLMRRAARIEAEPGWFQVYFRLTDVETPVRRVGLDLDPDFVPWLGIVMRFSYE